MRKTIAWVSLGVALCSPPVSAAAQSGSGVSPGAASASSFDRSHLHRSAERARASAASRHHGDRGGHVSHHHFQHVQ